LLSGEKKRKVGERKNILKERERNSRVGRYEVEKRGKKVEKRV